MVSAISVSELNERARAALAADVSLNDVWVSGEISALKISPQGHYYFTLKDAKSALECVLFRGSRNALAFEPAASMKVAAFGSVDVYVAGGRYQFKVSAMRRSGLGDMYLALEELKKKLEAEGLFDPSRKRKLPRYPRTVGVVTSLYGAVIHDIIRVAEKRFPADILIAPATVQGDGAAASIAKGIELLNTQDVDVIIVGRGGGSAEDLWAFNEEPVARAIAASRIPVISAVGHETDFTVSDMVADVRAPTPSAAAEIALPDIMREVKNLDGLVQRAFGSLGGRISLMQKDFKVLDSKLSVKRARETVEQYIQRLDDLSGTAQKALLRTVDEKRMCAVSAYQRMNAVDPMKVLERGYCYVKGPEGEALVSISQISPGSEVEIRMRDGSAKAKIECVRSEK